MSAVECESAKPDGDAESDANFTNEDVAFDQPGQFNEEDHFHNEDSTKPSELQPENPIRHVRPMRPQTPYRPGPAPRPPFGPSFRGHPRMPMPMSGNPRLPFMRPGMVPNRGGPPFDSYGPPPMGMPRGCPPPRYQQPPRFPPMNDGQNDEDMEDQQQSCNDVGGHEFDGPPSSNAFQGHGMRLRGPPPFMMGPNSGPHPSGPPGVPHGPPRGGPVPPGGPPFNGPPGQNFNGPQFNGPPMGSPNGPPFPGTQPGMSGPNSGPPFSGPHSGPPYGGPPFSGPPGSNMGPPNFSGPPPGPNYGGHTSTPEYSGPPPSSFSNQPPGPPFSGPSGPSYSTMSRPPFGPPFNVPSGPPSNAQPCPPPSVHSNLPPGVPPPVPPANCPPMSGPPPAASSSGMPPSAPSGPSFSGPPGHPGSQAPGVQSAPPYPSDAMHTQPPGAPSASPFAAAPPRPPFPPGGPVGIPSSTATSQPNMPPTATSGAATPSMCPPPVPQPTSTATTSPFGYPTGPVATSEGSPFPVPPGFPGMPPSTARPVSMPPGVPPQTLCSAPPAFPLHLMPPPPMSNLPVMPPGIPPFRGSLPFAPPTLPVGSLTHKTQTTQVKVGEDIWVENLTAEGKSYYYNMRTRETRWDRPEGVTLVKQDEVEHPAKASPAGLPGANTVTAPSANQKPPEVAIWAEYHNPEGKAYYHNTRTGETTWEKPKVLVDWEASRAPVKTSVESVQQSTVISSQNSVAIDSKPTLLSSETKKPDEPAVSEAKPENAVKVEEKSTSSTVENKEETSKASKDNSRPVSSTAVPGTPWCVVWTGDDRAFFFNPSQRLSVWEKPEELKGRADVDRLLERRPNANATPNSVADEESKVTSGEQEDADSGSSAAKKPRLEIDPGNRNSNEEPEVRKNGSEEDTSDVDKATGAPDKIPVGMEAAKEAEERAARERAVQPLEIRVNRFREMLVEMQVSAFSTWEKELHKIVFDPRYLLLTSKERRQTFEAYVKERAEEERREKKNKLKEKKDKFIELLEEAGLNSKSSFSEFSAKHQKDERFKAIDKSRDRESMFQEFMSDLRKREKDEKHREKEKTRNDFMNLLKEQKSLTKHSHWSDVKRKIHSDPRYKAVDSSSRREDWFREYVKKIDETPSREDSGARKEREKRERQEASIREREKEVKEALSSSMREREKERDQQLHNEQETNFRTMLLDIVRDPNTTWKEAKKALRKDSRWVNVGDVLPRGERDEIFKEHMATLAKKTRDFSQKSNSDLREKRNSTSEVLVDELNSMADDLNDVDKKDSTRR